MYISRNLLKTIIELLNMGFNAEEDVFGWHHNEATDVVSILERLLKDAK